LFKFLSRLIEVFVAIKNGITDRSFMERVKFFLEGEENKSLSAYLSFLQNHLDTCLDSLSKKEALIRRLKDEKAEAINHKKAIQTLLDLHAESDDFCNQSIKIGSNLSTIHISTRNGYAEVFVDLFGTAVVI